MVDGYSIAELEEALSAAMSAADVRSFVLGQETGFHASREPLTAVEDSTALSHLAFSVTVEDSAVADDDGASPGEGSVTVLAQTVVVFVVKIPASAQLDNYRTASRIARIALRALMSPSPHYEMRPLNIYRPGPVQNGFMPVEMRFQAMFDVTY
jgi:hypothetical protein